MHCHRINLLGVAIVAILAAGCSMFSRPTPEKFNDQVMREEAALDLIESRIIKQSAAAEKAGSKQNLPAAVPHQKCEAFDDVVLKYADWLYFAIYCVLAAIMAWYVRKTGRQNETLQKISDTVSSRLTLKHRLLFRILRFIYRKKKKKQEKKK